MFACCLSRYQISVMQKMCESILKDPTIRFSKNKYKVDLRNTCASILEELESALKYGDMGDDSEEGE